MERTGIPIPRPSQELMRTRNAAFTIIEALVALCLLMLCIMGVFSGLTLAYSQGAETRQQVMAHLLAESVIEDILAHPWGTTKAPPGWDTSGQNWTRRETVKTVIDGKAAVDQFEMTIQEIPSGAKVTISWREDSGPQNLNFEVPREKGWRTQPEFNRPQKVQESWHQPGPIQYSSEPANHHASGQDQSITIPDDNPGGTLTPEMVRLAKQIQDLRAQNDQLQAQVDDNNTQIDSLKEQKANAKTDAAKAEIQGQIDVLEAKNKNLNNQIDANQKKIDDLNSQLEKA